MPAVRPGELAAVGHHQPARDGVRVGPGDAASRCTARSCGRTGAPRSAVRAAARGGPRGADPRAHRPRARPVLLGHEDRVAARARRGAARAGAGRAGRCSGRSTRGCCSSSRASTSPTPPTRRARCSTTSLPGAGTRSCWSCSACPRARLREVVPSAGVLGPDAPRGAARPRRPASRASRATSRRRCSARRAWTRGWARTPTAPARSCCSTPASAPARPAPGLC